MKNPPRYIHHDTSATLERENARPLDLTPQSYFILFVESQINSRQTQTSNVE